MNFFKKSILKNKLENCDPEQTPYFSFEHLKTQCKIVYFYDGDSCTIIIKYEGNFKNGKRHGAGEIIFSNSEKFVGFWENGKVHGKGKIHKTTGKIIDGEWENDKIISTKCYIDSPLITNEVAIYEAANN